MVRVDPTTTISFYRFPLDFDLGYADCRVVDATPPGWLPMLFAQVYNPLYTPEMQDDYSSIPYFMNPIHIYAFPNVRGRGAWRELVRARDSRPFSLPDRKEEVQAGGSWNVIIGDLAHDISSRIQRVRYYGQVAHLEEDFIIRPRSIVIRTTLEWMKLQGLEPDQHYDLKDPLVAHEHRQSSRLPLLEMIPSAYRNKHLSEAELLSLTDGDPTTLPFH